MKTFILLFFISIGLFFVSCEKKSSDIKKIDTVAVSTRESIQTPEEDISFLKSLNETDILTKFFNPYKIIHDTAIWKQDIESIEMTVSADGYLHTVIDSIYHINNQLLIVFKTYEIETNGLIDNCHACGVGYSIALIEKEKENYSILRFKKHLTTKGSWGQGPKGEIIVFKKNLKTLKLVGGWTGTGTQMENEEYFNIHDFSNVF